MPIPHDRLFKELLTEFMYEFLDLFFPGIAAFMERDSIRFLDQDVFSSLGAGDAYRVDLLAEARLCGQESLFLLHVEPQAQHQEGFPRRLFRYYSHVYDKFDLPIYPIALFSYARPLRPEEREHLVSFPDGDVNRFTFRAVQLNRLDWRSFLHRKNPVAAALMTRMRIVRADRPRVKAHCLRILAGLPLNNAQRGFLGHFVDVYTPLKPEECRVMEDEIMRMEPEVRDMVTRYMPSWEKAGYDRGREEGRGEGREEGREEGRLEGEVEASRSVLLKILERRFGPVPEALRTELEAMQDHVRLEALAVEAGSGAGSLEEFRARL